DRHYASTRRSRAPDRQVLGPGPPGRRLDRHVPCGEAMAQTQAPNSRHTDNSMSQWQHLVRDVPDFPRPGILFKDITPVLADADGFAAAIAAMAEPWREVELNAVVGIESRGFILGAALSQALGTGFVPVRKPGRLPARTLSQDYSLEYGTDRLEIHVDALPPGGRVLLVDDVLATGG